MKILRKLNACDDGAGWAESQSSYREAWNNCDRGDWMLWIAKKRNVDLKKLTSAKVGCARLVEHLMKDKRSIKALDVAERFSRGEASKKELDAAADAAYAAASAAYANAYAAASADAAAYAAASAADAAAYANAYAAAAADAAAYAATYAAANAYAATYAAAAAADACAQKKARKDILKKSADICRQHISFDDLEIEEEL